MDWMTVLRGVTSNPVGRTEGLDGGMGCKCKLSVKILSICQLSVKWLEIIN